MTWLALLLAASTAAQEPSTATVHVAGDAPKPKLARPIKAVIPKEAKDWEPIALKEGGDPHQAATGATLRQVKAAAGGVKGVRSKAAAAVRVYKLKDGVSLLVISVYPQELMKKRKHFEVRLRMAEGNVEQAEAALMTVTDRRDYRELDKPTLRRLGMAFEEENPGSGLVTLSALDPRPGKTSWNAGKLSQAAFADLYAGFSDVSWSVKGVAAP